MRGLIALIFLVLVAGAAAMSAEERSDSSATAVASGAEGGFELSNSRDGMPIFTAANVGPGGSAEGTVEIANPGIEATEVELSQHDLTDVPGLGGGTLSGRFELRIEDLSRGSALVYSGPLAGMPVQRLGRFEPGEARTYRFLATLHDSADPAAENAAQGASMRVAYAWTAHEAQVPPEHPAEIALAVRLTRAGRAIRHGRVLLWARCNEPCRIRPRARVRAPRGLGRARARTRPAKRGFTAAPQRIAILLPRSHHAREVLANFAGRPRIRVALRARDVSGERARASRVLRLRRHRK